MRALGRLTSLGLLSLSLLAGSASGGPAVLDQPDPRAILPLVSRSGNLLKYGTGVVVARDTLLTAEHVLSETVEILLPGSHAPGQPACRTQFAGLAVIKATLPPGTPQYRLAFRPPSVGETVTVAGYPLRKWRVSTGRVIRILQTANLSGRVVAAPMMAVEPALDYGASGSPVLDRAGLVIGIAVASNQEDNYTIAFPIASGLRACRTFVK